MIATEFLSMRHMNSTSCGLSICFSSMNRNWSRIVAESEPRAVAGGVVDGGALLENWRRGLELRTHTKKHQSLFLRDFRVCSWRVVYFPRRSILAETVETRRTGTQLSCPRRNDRPAIAGGTDKLSLLSDNRCDGPEHSRQITRRRNYLSRSG